MSNEQMDRDYRADSQLERACRDAERALMAVLSDEQSKRFNGARKAVLKEALTLCRNTADHIVAVWD